MIADERTDIDNTASINASDPLATKESELASFPFLFTYNPRINFTKIPLIRMIKLIVVYFTFSGWIIFLIDSIKAVNPAYKTIIEIIREVIYSILPCP